MLIPVAFREVEAVADWFEKGFPCRQSYADEKELAEHIELELAKWLPLRFPDWIVRKGHENFVSLFGWTLHTDMELRNEKTSDAVPVEVKLTKQGSEYGTLHALGQAVYYATKERPALALVVDQGRASDQRTEIERKLQNELWWMFNVKLAFSKP